MKEKCNWKLMCSGLLSILLGIGLVLLDLFGLKTTQNLWISIGCSLIASGVGVSLTSMFFERLKINPLDEWGIKKIYLARSEANVDTNLKLEKAKYCLDGVCFGLQSFRTTQQKKIENCLRNGVNIRLLTMMPDSKWIEQREKEESEAKGSISYTIKELVSWADDLNKRNYKGKIIVKGYDAMTLDFYWRIDNSVFVGPYWYGRSSQQTITYMYEEGKKGFQVYTEYFDSLWNNENLNKTLTKVTEQDLFKRRKRS